MPGLTVYNGPPTNSLGVPNAGVQSAASAPTATSGLGAAPSNYQPAYNPMGYVAPATHAATQPAPSGGGTTYSAPAPVYYDSAGNSYSSQAAANAASATIAQLNQGIGNVNAGLGRLPGQLDVGTKNIESAYNDAFNQLIQQKATDNATYDTNKHQTATDYVGAKNTIGSNAGASLNGLERLLGMHGAGGSSAALFNAPGAVARNATIQRTGAGDTFGKNNQVLDTNWNNYLTGEQNAEKDLGSQKQNQTSSLQAQIDTSRAGLLQSLATLQGQLAAASGGNAVSAAQPYLDQANGLLSAADQLGLQVPVLKTAPVTYTAPTLDNYTVNPNAAPTLGNNAQGANDFISPYLSLLLGKDKTQPAVV